MFGPAGAIGAMGMESARPVRRDRYPKRVRRFSFPFSPVLWLTVVGRDIPFAYKTLLRAVEMSSVPYPGGNDPKATEAGVLLTEGMAWNEIVTAGGWKTRVWWGLAVVSLSPSVPPL